MRNNLGESYAPTSDQIQARRDERSCPGEGSAAFAGVADGRVLVLVTMALYWPATSHDFVNYDDPLFVTENLHVQGGLTWAGAKWAFQLFN